MVYKRLKILDASHNEGLHRNSDVPLNDTATGDESIEEPSIGNPEMVNKVRDAAVLVPLVKLDSEWHILFIRRADNQRDRHSGQVAFPGGARDANDATLVHTALREAHEEIGLASDRIQILAQLDNYFTISRYRVTPVVGVVRWPSNLNLQSSEVARAFLMPLNWLRDHNNFTLRARSDMDAQSAQRHPIIVFEPYDGETLWGATARMTVNFIKAVDDGKILLPPDNF